MRRLLLLASLSLLTLVAVPAAQSTPTPPASTWTPGSPQPKAGTTATMRPSSLSTPEPGQAQSPIAIPAVGTPPILRAGPARSRLLAIGIAILVALAGLSRWLKPSRRRR